MRRAFRPTPPGPDLLEEKEKKEDERILAINLDSCPPPLRTYYEIRQHGILEKAAARRRNEQGP